MARTTLVLDEATIRDAVRTQQQILLQFERGDLDLPIVTGLVRASSTVFSQLMERPMGQAEASQKVARGQQDTPEELLLRTSKTSAEELRVQSSGGSASTGLLEVKLDGKSVVLEADNEIELRCGKASIKLTRDGKVIVRGAYVETHSRGVNRIKGGVVRIN